MKNLGKAILKSISIVLVFTYIVSVLVVPVQVKAETLSGTIQGPNMLSEIKHDPWEIWNGAEDETNHNFTRQDDGWNRFDIAAVDFNWQPRIMSNRFSLIPGESYTFSFKAKAAKEKYIQVNFLDAASDNGPSFVENTGILLGTDEQEYSFTINVPSEYNADQNPRLDIWLGRFDYSIDNVEYHEPKEPVTVYFKNLSLTRNIDANSVLSDLKVGGTTIQGFVNNVFEYSVKLDEGSSIPEVTATAAGDGTANIEGTTQFPGKTKVTVTAANGKKNTYIVEFLPKPKTVLAEDFEGQNIGNAAEGWVSNSASVTATVYGQPVGANNTKFLKLDYATADWTTPGINNVNISKNFEPVTGKLEVHYEFYDEAQDAGGASVVRFRNSQANMTAFSFANQYGIMYNIGDDEGQNAGTQILWDPDNLTQKWVTVDIAADIKANKCTIKINGTPLSLNGSEELPFQNAVTSIDSISFGKIRWMNGIPSYFDNISVMSSTPVSDPTGPVVLPTNSNHAINYHYNINTLPFQLPDGGIPAGGTRGFAISVAGTGDNPSNPETNLVYKFKIVPPGQNPDDAEFFSLNEISGQGVRITKGTRPWNMTASFNIETACALETKEYELWPYVSDVDNTWQNKSPYPLYLKITGLNDSQLKDRQDPELKEVGAVDKRIIALNIQEGTVKITGQIPYNFAVGEEVRVSANGDMRDIYSAAGEAGQYKGKLAVDNNEVYLQVGTEPEVRYVYQGGDIIRCTGENQFELIRNAAVIGKIRMVNPKIWIPESIEGKPINRFALEKTDTFSVVQGGNAVAVTNVYRKEKINNKAVTDNGFTFDHWVFIELAEELKEGQQYIIELKNGLSLRGSKISDNKITFTHDSKANRSEAIHVSHTGFKPDDGLKQGFLSIWLGDGGEHAYNVTSFNLVNTGTGKVDYTGNIKLIRAFNQIEEMSPNSLPYENTAKTNVYSLDFSNFNKKGNYVVQIDGIGTSYPFEIGDKVWEEVFKISTNGLYYNRSGIAKDGESYKTPRAYHPDEGTVVYQSTVGLFETGNGYDASGTGHGNFADLIATRTENTLRPDAIWGGYHDAADWDRRIQHLSITMSQLELMLMFPGAYDKVDMGLPDSALVYNSYKPEDLQKAGLTAKDVEGIPDLLAEALWNIDFYRRMQVIQGDWIPNGQDWLGGIRGGIETTEHPTWGEASWQESLVIMAYAPDAWTSYIYAGAASRASFILESLGKTKLAALYKESAVKAYEYAQKDFDASYGANKLGNKWHEEAQKAVVYEKALAEVELYRLTKDQKYHTNFKATMNSEGYGSYTGKLFDKAAKPTWLYDFHDSIFAYIMLPSKMTDSSLVEEYKKVIVGYNPDARKAYGSAEHTLAYMDRNTWGASTWDEGVPLIGFCAPFGTPHVDAVIRAHYITKDKKYRDAVIKSTQFGLGANQDNMAMTTGVGYEYPKNTLHLESRQTGRANPPGITIYGSFKLDELAGWPISIPGYAYPSIFPIEEYAATGQGLSNWPTAESFLDMFLYPGMLEWTVHQIFAPTTYAWGYLAGSDEAPGTSNPPPANNTGNTSNSGVNVPTNNVIDIANMQKYLNTLSNSSTISTEDLKKASDIAAILASNLMEGKISEDKKCELIEAAANAIGSLATIISKAESNGYYRKAIDTTLEMLAAIIKSADTVKEAKNADKVTTGLSTTVENAAKLALAIKGQPASEKLTKEVISLAQKIMDRAGTQALQPKIDGSAATVEVSEDDAKEILAKIDAMADAGKRLEDSLKKGVMGRELNKTFTIELDLAEAINSLQASIPSSIINSIISKDIDRVGISCGIAEVFISTDDLSKDGLNSVALEIKQADREKDLTGAQRKVVGNNPVLDLNLTLVKNDGSKVKVSNFNKAVEVRVPYQLAAGQNPDRVTVFYINDKGELENKYGIYDTETKTVVFTTEHFSKYVIKENMVYFDDLNKYLGYKPYIDFVTAKGIMGSVKKNKFMPTAHITRGEFASILAKALKLGSQDSTFKSSFTDVKQGDKYYSSLAAIERAGLIKADSTGLFRPNDKITREEMVFILAKAALEFRGLTPPADTDSYVAQIKDAGSIKPDTKEAIAMLAKYNIMGAKVTGNFLPRGNTTRAELARIIYMLVTSK